MEKRSKYILERLDEKERNSFLSGLLDVVDESIKLSDTRMLTEYLDQWEAVAEINEIPGLKERALARFNHFKSIGRIQ